MEKTSLAHVCCLLVIFFATVCDGFYLPGTYMHTVTHVYYNLPYCKPPGGIKKSAENLGELLVGDQIDNSPYRFKMNQNKSLYLCTTSPLNENEVKLLKHRTRDVYQVNMILDNLPMDRYPVGYAPPQSNEDYIINHLKFKLLIHVYEGSGVVLHGTGEPEKKSRYEIVGFEVILCSIKHDLAAMKKLMMYDNVDPLNCPVDLEKSQIIRKEEQVSFAYEVEFVKSDIRWPSRWDAYLKMEEGAGVHWVSITNSLMVIFLLACVVFVIFLRTVRRDLATYEEVDREAQAQMNEELFGWKLVVTDVFREPTYSKLLCAMVGDGTQILGMVVVTIIFAALGLYLFLGIVAGYVGVRLWITIKFFFPGIVFVILTALNFVLWGSKSTGAIPISLYFMLLSLWFCISIPLTLLAFGRTPLRSAIEIIPTEIPARKYPSWLLTLVGGIISFGTLFIELFFILSSIWLGRFYYFSVILTYMHQCAEDWQWWWKAFFTSGSVSLYVFIYSIYYLMFDLRSLSGPVSAMLYLGYSLIMAIAIMLATGTIGFLFSFHFLHCLLSSVKSD
ncbi:hypothetical protein MKX03_037202 [Papaver bracteatum]|nr:hypothetical protein MKX03_037202 [Papaver bracteatum]